MTVGRVVLSMGLALASAPCHAYYTITDLGALTGANLSFGEGINCQVTGYFSTTGASSFQAFVYTPGVGMQFLDPPAGSNSIVGLAINSQGQVTGHSSTGPDSAFVYTPGVGVESIPAGGRASAGVKINDSGQVAGATLFLNTQRAFVFTPRSTAAATLFNFRLQNRLP